MMLELPEAIVMARQINKILSGKIIRKVIAAHSPHKFAWYYGDPQNYPELLEGKQLGMASNVGGMVEIQTEKAKILFSDGVNLRYYKNNEKIPNKHQLYIEFDDGTFVIGSVQMYGGLVAFPEGKYDNKYYLISKAKPSPLSDSFNTGYYNKLFDADSGKLSLKAFLATEQRIPGLGNGVLQDILFNSEMHPKKKISTLSEMDKKDLFSSIKAVLNDMAVQGGRDTEKDLLGNFGRYKTILSKNTIGQPCPVCGNEIHKEAYMGGSIYYCLECQKI
jgi:formamidopyrimidine-DNA glycosylase